MNDPHDLPAPGTVIEPLGRLQAYRPDDNNIARAWFGPAGSETIVSLNVVAYRESREQHPQ